MRRLKKQHRMRRLKRGEIALLDELVLAMKPS